MDKLNEIAGIVTGGRSMEGAILIGLTLLFFGIGLYFWLGRYARLARYRNPKRDVPREVDGISVVVILTDDFQYLDETLPKIMGQHYPDFEVVVVDLNSSPEFADELRAATLRYPNLTTARLDPNPRFRISNKMIYNVGIKSARYDNVMLTTPDAYPVSPRWLDCMAKGFANGEIVIGYCGIAQPRGIGARLMWCGRFMMSVRYLSSAIRGRTYRGILQNIGFNRRLYIEKRGFNHLDTTLGEDDLFIQKIAPFGQTAVIMNSHAITRQTVYGGVAGWWRGCRLSGSVRRFYPPRAKRAITTELIFRFLLMLSVIGCALLLPLYTALGAVALWVGRMCVVRYQTARTSRRLGEKGLSWMLMFYDIAEPFIHLMLRISRMVHAPKEIWK